MATRRRPPANRRQGTPPRSRGPERRARAERMPRAPGRNQERAGRRPPVRDIDIHDGYGSQPNSEADRVTVPRGYSKRGMSFSANIVAALFFAFILVYMGWQAYGFFEPNVASSVVRFDDIEMVRSVPGIIIRTEYIVHSEREGQVFFYPNNFERVRQGSPVASIQDADVMDGNIIELAELEEDIIGVHGRRPYTHTDPMIEQMNANMMNIIDDNMQNFSKSNLQEIYSLLGRLTQITTNRQRAIITESVHVRSELGSRHGLLMSQRDMNHLDLLAPTSGVVSPFIDGFENELTRDTMRLLTREQVNQVIDHTAILPVRDVEPGDPVFKIVRNNWYVASFMPTDMVQDFVVNTDRVMYLENATTGRFEAFTMRVIHNEYQHLRENLVILRSTRNVIDFLNQRNVNIRLTDNVQRGLVIPTSAIAIRRFIAVPLEYVHGIDAYFVMFHGDHGLTQVQIAVTEMTATHAYVAHEAFPLPMGTFLVPVDLEDQHHRLTDDDMRIIRGVYRSTMGFADFTVIHLDEDEAYAIDTATEVLLDPARNPGIRQFYTIVTDASSVRQGQPVH